MTVHSCRFVFQALAGALLAALLPPPLGAQTSSSPSQPAVPESAPVAISDLFVVPWHHDELLACMSFTNTSQQTIQAVRFGLINIEKNVLGENSSRGYVDRLGSFAPGIAIRGPQRIFGTIVQTNETLRNCWETDRPSAAGAPMELQINILKAVYADGAVWINPTPSQPMASVRY
jgi:hypothetical protein